MGQSCHGRGYRACKLPISCNGGIDVQAGSLEDACKALLEKGYAVVALNPKQNFWDPVRKTQLVYIPPQLIYIAAEPDDHSLKRKCATVGGNSNLCLVSRLLCPSWTDIENDTSTSHIQYVMDKVMSLSPAREAYIFSHWGSCHEILEYLNTTCTYFPYTGPLG